MQTIPNWSDILLAVIDATPDAIFVKDLEGRYVLVNQAAAKFVRRTPAEVVGKHDLAPVHRRRLPIIFVSGFSAVAEAQKGINDIGAPLLSKPSTLSQLERAVNAVMLRPSTSSGRPELSKGAAPKILRRLEELRVGIVRKHQPAAFDAVDQLARHSVAHRGAAMAAAEASVSLDE